MPISYGTMQNAAEHLLKVASWTAPSAVYVALSTTDPGYDGSTITEVSGGSYARVQHEGASNWVLSSGTDNQYENNNAITFPTATGSWGTITHFALYDASTAGNFLAGGSLTTAKSVSSSDVLSFADAALKISFS